MSHESKVYAIVFALVASLIFFAEKTKNLSFSATPSTNSVISFSQSNTSALVVGVHTKKATGFDAAQVLLDQEVAHLNQGVSDWKQREAVVRAQAAKLSQSELMTLAQVSVDTETALNDRLMAVYLISLADLRGHNALFEIVKTPVPVTANENQEISLRLRALQGLDQMAVVNPTQVQKTMLIVTASTAAAKIKAYAQISLSGFAQGHPAHLSQWLSQVASSHGE